MLKKQIIPIVRAFQSALPRGERQQIGGSPDEDRNISIHAPTRGATVKYRQWKKNYKKKHGVNPPLWLDRKKRRRYIRKRVRRIAASLEVNVEIITKGLEASVMAIKKRLIELQERIVARESEAVEND